MPVSALRSFLLVSTILLGGGLLLAGGFITSPSTGPSGMASGPASTAPADTQHIALEEGWNLISSRLVPDDPSMEAVFAPIADAVEVVKSPSGAVYRPSDGTNTIGTWDVREGYEVYVTSPQTLIIEGRLPTASESSISLQEGWNTVSYLPATARAPTEALASIDGGFTMVKDGAGNVLVPTENVNQLGELRPGEGYKVHATTSTVLNYPTEEELFAYDAQCKNQPDAHLVHTFGTLTEGRQVEDSLAIRQNTAAINTALQEVGQKGGGTVCLPKGVYQVRPHPDEFWDPSGHGTSIVINHSDITLWGAGRNDDGNGTGLYSRGEYAVVEGMNFNDIRRGRGMRVGNPSVSSPPLIENIVLRGFELNGQGALPGDSTAWTGCKTWRSREGAINCWDVTHKGIIVASHTDVDNVLIKNVAVRSFKGELLYQGGDRLGFAELDNIISEDTNAQGSNLVADSLRIKDSHFGLSNQWYEMEAMWESTAYITGTTHDKVDESFSVVFAQGDASTVNYVFEDNHFTGCDFQEGRSGQAFFFAEGVAGPVTVRNNTFDDCGLFTTGTGGTEGIDPHNIIFEDNTVENLKGTAGFSPSYPIAFEVRGNTFSWSDGEEGAPFNFGFGGTDYEGVIEGNDFNTPEPANSDGGSASMHPLMQNNTYDISWGPQEASNIYPDNRTITPLFEEQGINLVHNDTLEVNIRTGSYADGQEVKFIATSDGFVFSNEKNSLSMEQDTVLANGESLLLRYDAGAEYWTEP